MTSTTDFDRLVESWLQDAGPGGYQTRRRRDRPGRGSADLTAARGDGRLTAPAAWPKARRRTASLGDLPPALRLALVAGLLALAVGALALLGVGSSPAPSPTPGPTQLGVVVAPAHRLRLRCSGRSRVSPASGCRRRCSEHRTAALGAAVGRCANPARHARHRIWQVRDRHARPDTGRRHAGEADRHRGPRARARAVTRRAGVRHRG